MSPEDNPIFYDPERIRWKRVKWSFQLLGTAFSLVFGALIISILINPALPQLGLQGETYLPQSHHLGLPQAKTILNGELRQIRHYRKRFVRPLAASLPRPAKEQPVLAYFVNWDDTSFTSLKQNLARFDVLVPEWLHLSQADGTLTEDDPHKREAVLAHIRQNRPELKIVPLINNFNSKTLTWESQKLGEMLASPVARTHSIDLISAYIKENHFNGVSIDFESVPDKSHKDLLAYMTELHARFKAVGWEVSQSVPLDDPNFDYPGLASVNDYLILMAYDEHSGESEAGPVASQAWFASALERRFSQLPSDKYVIALGNYGYDWTKGAKAAKEVSFQEAIVTAKESEGQIELAPRGLNPHYDYQDGKNVLHHVWFLDAVTLFNQIVASQKHNPRGFALWRLGSEDPSIWPVFERRHSLDAPAADTLQTIRYGYDLDYEGKGEILKVSASPQVGSRQVTFDKETGLVVTEKVTKFPSPYVITRLGGEPKKRVVLTFDDGPDATYTPQILDILKQYGVKATFFIVGLNADLNSSLLQRIWNEGHELGNHTFTHPNISQINEKWLDLELSATERLIESQIGRKTLLFRPPYAEDIEPVTPQQVKPLLHSSALGYYTIGIHIDPMDWKAPGVDKIVNAAIAGAERGDGSVILLHDSGGDRSQTVAALPKIIEAVQKRGFEIVSISQLMGVSRDVIMPAIPARERMVANLNDAGFVSINVISSGIHYLFIIGIVLGLLRLLMMTTLAIVQKRSERHRVFVPGYAPLVSIIVPAYNEAKVILKTLRSLLMSEYENFEIIVVDDGSKDETVATVNKWYQNDARIQVITQTNGGKAKALNNGIARARGEIIIGLDADTIFRPNAISMLVRHFSDKNVGAVAGNAKVGNRINLLTLWQAVEYITSQNLDRRAFDTLNCITVVPGAIGAWRRSLILEAGGFSETTLAEDADLTLSVLRRGFDVRYEDEAIALTEAPDTVRAFIKQRFRWMYGTMQASWKHMDTLFRPKFKALGMVALPNILIFQIFFPLISPVMDLLMLWSVISTAWDRYQHPLDFNYDSLQRVLFYYALFLLVDFLTSLVAFLMERREDWSLLVWLFLQRFFYRQLMYYVAIKSTLVALRGSIVGWGNIERKATVK